MTWREELQQNLTTAKDLEGYLKLSNEDRDKLEAILKIFPMRVTRYYLSLINWENYENDPIFKMAVPSIRETDLSGDLDTSGEHSNTKMRGLQHKYHATALVLTTQECAMYCRYCFRRRLVGKEAQEETADPASVAAYIISHPEINNVLLSGGDSFLMDNHAIEDYLDRLTKIDSLDLIRFGTRTPVTFPMRITSDPALLKLLGRYNKEKQIVVVTHFNHPHEITPQSTEAVRLLREQGIIIRNQTVLLRGVNDDGKTLGKLLRKLTGIGVLPYYVFQCRPVKGVKSQFQVPFKRGYQIVEEAKAQQNGQGKAFRYVLSHPTGKIELIGPAADGNFLFKYHQAKYDKDQGRIFELSLDDDQCWLGEIPEEKGT